METSQDIHQQIKYDTEVVVIDEVQFFDDGIVELCNKLADNGKRVIVAGLDLSQIQPAEPNVLRGTKKPWWLALPMFMKHAAAIVMRYWNSESVGSSSRQNHRYLYYHYIGARRTFLVRHHPAEFFILILHFFDQTHRTGFGLGTRSNEPICSQYDDRLFACYCNSFVEFG